MTHEDFKTMKRQLKLTNASIAEITGLSTDSVKTMTQPNRELPAWAKSMIFVWNLYEIGKERTFYNKNYVEQSAK